MDGPEHEPQGGEPEALRPVPDDDLLSRAMPGDLGAEHDRPPEPAEGPPDQPEEREADEDRPTPRIYVASLSDYNTGRLHGVWIDAAQEADELYVDISTMLSQSPGPEAEEWAIHDYENFGPLSLSEYESVETISRLGLGIAEHGLAFAAWAQHVGDDVEQLERFARVYLGRWDSVEAYAEELLVDFGARSAIDTLPAWLQQYVALDAAGFARDLQAGGQVWAVPVVGGEGVEIFDETIWQWTIP